MFVFSVLRNRFSSKKKIELRTSHPKSASGKSSNANKNKIPKPTFGALIEAFFVHRKLTNQVTKKQILAAKQNCNKKLAQL